MLETLGFISIAEADSILEFNLIYDSWDDPNVYEQTSGTWNSHGEHDSLHGTNTLALTELAIDDLIAIQYETAKITAIDDNFHITLDKTVHTVDHAKLEIITPEQRIYLESMWLKKKKSLLTAFSFIETYINIPSIIPDNLKNAQAYLAATLYISGTTTTGVSPNVKRYKLGDMEYEFNSTAGSGNSAMETFPKQVYELLKPYLKNLKSFATVTTSAR